MDRPPQSKARQFFRFGFFFELALLPLASILCWFHFDDPFDFDFTVTDIESLVESLIWGLTATVPLVVYAVLATSTRGLEVPAFRRIYEKLSEHMGEGILAMGVLQLALISIAAGVGEEFLFRGVLQRRWGMGTAALIFGLMHALTPTYFFLTFVMGAYLGWIFYETENLLAPIIVHALYDFIALLIVKRRLKIDAAFAETEIEMVDAQDAPHPNTDISSSGAETNEETNDHLPEDHRR